MSYFTSSDDRMLKPQLLTYFIEPLKFNPSIALREFSERMVAGIVL